MFSLEYLSADRSLQAHRTKMISDELYFNRFLDVDVVETFCKLTAYNELLK